MKKAFTMIELVFVIVVMGIVASIGAEIISKLYENYIYTASINRLQAQTETLLEQIAKRLTYRIKDSVIAKKFDGSIEKLASSNGDYKILEWIGKDNEGFKGDWNGSRVVPGWSGFVDLDSNETNRSQIKTSGSRLDFAENIINTLSYGDINISTSTGANATVIFKGQDFNDINQFGWNGNDANYTYNIQRHGNDVDVLMLDKNASTIYEQYNLAWSAYAIVPEGNLTGNDFNLTLYYNFQPWDGDEYNSSDTNRSTLAQHVSSFKFMQIGNTIRLKLCIRDSRRSGGDDFGFCKEKVVF